MSETLTGTATDIHNAPRIQIALDTLCNHVGGNRGFNIDFLVIVLVIYVIVSRGSLQPLLERQGHSIQQPIAFPQPLLGSPGNAGAEQSLRQLVKHRFPLVLVEFAAAKAEA